MFQLDTCLLNLVQSIGEAFEPIMKSLSTIGEAKYYFAVIILLMWCVNFKAFARLALMIPLCGALTESLKLAFHIPRPYHVESGAEEIASYGMPSGHAMSAVTFWGFLACMIKKKWSTILAIVLILGICISRVYQGSHYPSQVTAGLLIGLLVLLAFLLLQNKVVGYVTRCSTPVKHILVLLPAIVPVTVALAASLIYSDGTGMENLRETITNCGLYYGFALALNITWKNRIRYHVRVGIVKQIIKAVVCIVCILIYINLNKYSGKLMSLQLETGMAILFGVNVLTGLGFLYYIPRVLARFHLIHSKR